MSDHRPRPSVQPCVSRLVPYFDAFQVAVDAFGIDVKCGHGMRHFVKIRPVRVKWWVDTLSVNSIRIAGYRASCSCGWKGSVKSSVAVARLQFSWHVTQEKAALGVVDRLPK
jgi:hypothetical protein